MPSAIGKPRYLFVPTLVLLAFLVPSAFAQQPPAQPPAPTPPDSQSEKPKDGKDDQDKKTPAPAQATTDDVGKSKLEQETGTINDRIFDVVPNYGTVETSKSLSPLTTGQKFRLATAGVFDWGSFTFNAGLAAISQAKDDPKSWGQGWGAYGQRYGASFADNSIGTYMTTAIFPSLLHEDPRYYQMGKGSFVHRAYHALNRLFVTRTDSGEDRFNFSESLGNAAAAALSNVYHAPEDRTASRNASTFAFLILYDGLDNELKEFWPDIRRKVFHQKTPQL
ncbi:MAG: hypothetical protein WAJ96_03035 [Candidatus Acidiferrum sp.]